MLLGLEPYKNDGKIAGGVITKTAPAVFGLLAALELHPSNKLAGGTHETSLYFFRRSSHVEFFCLTWK